MINVFDEFELCMPNNFNIELEILKNNYTNDEKFVKIYKKYYPNSNGVMCNDLKKLIQYLTLVVSS